MQRSFGTAALAAIGGMLFAAVAVHAAPTTSINSGSLGALGNGTNASGVLVQALGAVGAGGGLGAYYSGGNTVTPVNTTLPFHSELNPPSGSLFTIEFWVNPASDVID